MDEPIQLLSPSQSLLLEIDVEGGPEKERIVFFFVNLISWYHDEHVNKSSTLLPPPPRTAGISRIRSTNHIRLSCEHYFQQHPIYNLKTLQRSSISLSQPLSPSPHGSLHSTGGSGLSPTNSLNMRSLPIHSPPGSLGGHGVRRHELNTHGSNGSINRSAGSSGSGSSSSLRGIDVASSKFSSLGNGSSKRGLDFSSISSSEMERLRRGAFQQSTSDSRLSESSAHHAAATPSSPLSSLSSNATSGVGLGGPSSSLLSQVCHS